MAPGSAELYATVSLYPVADLYIASDRSFLPHGLPPTKIPEDVVFAAVTVQTERFLKVLPLDPCEDFLDLCSGTGIAALVAAKRCAKRAYACDLGARCVHFSEFNRRLNGLENVWTGRGNLYEPVRGHTFDRIVAHPPYVPSKERGCLFRDGGEDGEQVFAGIVREAPEYLRPGGRLHCLTVATDRRSGDLEQRIRQWLGPAEAEFDVFVVALRYPNSPGQVVEGMGKDRDRPEGDDRSEFWEQLGVTERVYGTVTLVRHAAQRASITARTAKEPQVPEAVIEAFRECHCALAAPDLADTLGPLVPALNSSLRLQVTHIPGPEGLSAQSCVLSVSVPFVCEAQVEPWIGALLGLCDGQRTVAAIHRQLQTNGVIDEQTGMDQLIEVWKVLIGYGYLSVEIPGLKL